MRTCGAVILAAGGSTRFGSPKQLQEIDGVSLVRRITGAALEAGCAPVAVVVGQNAEAIEEELRGLTTVIVRNAEWQRGLGTSIRAGVSSLLECEAIALLACDQPFVDAALIKALTAEAESSGKAIVASRYANTLGVPAVFDRSCFNGLLILADDSGAKPLIESNPDDVAEFQFERGAVDIDTPADLGSLSQKSV